jgi:hypothetical protein
MKMKEEKSCKHLDLNQMYCLKHKEYFENGFAIRCHCGQCKDYVPKSHENETTNKKEIF